MILRYEITFHETTNANKATCEGLRWQSIEDVAG